MDSINPVNVLVVSGLRSFDADPWQDWLEHRYADATWVRPQPHEWPDLDRWSQRIRQALQQAPHRPWLVWSHGFGCLAAAHYVQSSPAGPLPDALVLMAPADPRRYGIAEEDLRKPLPCISTLVAAADSDGDHCPWRQPDLQSRPPAPWLQGRSAQSWAVDWGCQFVDAGRGPSLAAPAAWAQGQRLLEQQMALIGRRHLPAPMQAGRPTAAYV